MQFFSFLSFTVGCPSRGNSFTEEKEDYYSFSAKKSSSYSSSPRSTHTHRGDSITSTCRVFGCVVSQKKYLVYSAINNRHRENAEAKEKKSAVFV